MVECEVKIDYAFNPQSSLTFVPDLVVVCDREKITEKRILGAPDLATEILSPSNADHDKEYKYRKYLSAGVIEYWIVDPEAEEIKVNLLNKEGEYEETTYTKGEVIKVFILDNLSIDVTDLFEGYKGAEILEVEVARKEEREKAAEMEKLAREEEKLATIKRLLKMGLSPSEVAQGAEVDLDIVLRIANEIDES